ncbi:MAG: hypothetical protein IJL87_02600 [Clostridia bacterium]|nr:hypothetical protein [Clostridia bacterium]
MGRKYAYDGEGMSEKGKNILALCVAAAILIAIFIFVPGFASDDAEKLYGTWERTDGVYQVYEFSTNGAVVLSNETVNFSGKYTVNGNKLHVQLADREADCTFSFDGDILVIVNEKGEESRLKKVDREGIDFESEAQSEIQSTEQTENVTENVPQE